MTNDSSGGMVKRYGDVILVVLPDDTCWIEAPVGLHPDDLRPAYVYASELGYQHADTIHLVDEGMDVTLLSR